MKRTKTLDALLGRRVSVTIRKSFPWKKGTITGKLVWRNGYNVDTGFHLVKVDPSEIEEVKGYDADDDTQNDDSGTHCTEWQGGQWHCWRRHTGCFSRR